MARTESIFAYEIVTGDVIVCPNGDSITVETITRWAGDDLIEFAGKQTSYSYSGNVVRDGGMFNQFWDEYVTILARA